MDPFADLAIQFPNHRFTLYYDLRFEEFVVIMRKVERDIIKSSSTVRINSRLADSSVIGKDAYILQHVLANLKLTGETADDNTLSDLT
jgi:hypothetical protein